MCLFGNMTFSMKHLISQWGHTCPGHFQDARVNLRPPESAKRSFPGHSTPLKSSTNPENSNGRTEEVSQTQEGDESNRPEPDDDLSPDHRHDIIHGLALFTDEQRCLTKTLRHQNARSAQRLFEDLRRRIERLLEHEAYSGDAVLMQNLFDDEIWDVAGVADINGAQGRERPNSIIREGSGSGSGHGVDGSGGSTGCHQPNGTDGHQDEKVKQQ